jgi:hypothetical protein
VVCVVYLVVLCRNKVCVHVYDPVMRLFALQVAMAKNAPPLPAADPTTCPNDLVALLRDCLLHNPRERPGSGEVMKRIAHMLKIHCPA